MPAATACAGVRKGDVVPAPEHTTQRLSSAAVAEQPLVAAVVAIGCIGSSTMG